MELFYRGLAYEAYLFALFIPRTRATCKYRGVAYTKPASLTVAVLPASVLKFRGQVYTKQAFNLDPKSVHD